MRKTLGFREPVCILVTIGCGLIVGGTVGGGRWLTDDGEVGAGLAGHCWVVSGDGEAAGVGEEGLMVAGIVGEVFVGGVI